MMFSYDIYIQEYHTRYIATYTIYINIYYAIAVPLTYWPEPQNTPFWANTPVTRADRPTND